jgi:hypothetical protein
MSNDDASKLFQLWLREIVGCETAMGKLADSPISRERKFGIAYGLFLAAYDLAEQPGVSIPQEDLEALAVVALRMDIQ